MANGRGVFSLSGSLTSEPTSKKASPTSGLTQTVESALDKISSSALKSYLLGQYKDDLIRTTTSKTELAQRYATLIRSIGESRTAERSLVEKIKEGATPGLAVLELWTQRGREERSVLGSVEDWFGSLGEDMRLASSGNVFDEIRTQIALGVIGGVYSGVKGMILSIPELLELGWKLFTDAKTRGAAWELYKKFLFWNLKLQFGTPSMRLQAARELKQTLDAIWELVSASVAERWQEASDEGTEVELVSAWLAQGVFEVATAALAVTKGAKAVKAAKGAAEAASVTKSTKALQATAKLETALSKTAGPKKALEPVQSLSKNRYIAKFVSHAEVLETIGEKAAALLRKAPRTVRRKVLRDLSEFIPSATDRLGKTVVGRQVFLENPLIRENIVKKMIDTVSKIERGQPVDVYMIILKDQVKGGSKFLKEATKGGAKGPSFVSYAHAKGATNRLGKGRYVAVGEFHTARFELFDRGMVPQGYAILKAKFQPQNRLQFDFHVVPSVREAGGVNLVDKNLRDWTSFKEIEVLWDVSWDKID
jgi:hypothetical protein